MAALYYVDTSLIAAYYTPEPLSDEVEEFLRSQNRPGVSSLTELELFSALSREVREEGLDPPDAGKVGARFLAHLENEFFSRVPVGLLNIRPSDCALRFIASVG